MMWGLTSTVVPDDEASRTEYMILKNVPLQKYFLRKLDFVVEIFLTSCSFQKRHDQNGLVDLTDLFSLFNAWWGTEKFNRHYFVLITDYTNDIKSLVDYQNYNMTLYNVSLDNSHLYTQCS